MSGHSPQWVFPHLTCVGFKWEKQKNTLQGKNTFFSRILCVGKDANIIRGKICAYHASVRVQNGHFKAFLPTLRIDFCTIFVTLAKMRKFCVGKYVHIIRRNVFQNGHLPT